MRLVTKGFALLASLVLVLALPAVAQQLNESESVSGFHGMVEGAPNLVAKKDQGRSATQAVNVVYDNTGSAANFGVSSTDLTSIWGDQILLTGTGLLSSHTFSLFNSGSSLGPLLTANVQIEFYDTNTAALLGGYTTSVNFGAGLPAGFFSLVTVTGLDPLVINIPVTDIIVLQTVLSKTGTANRLGVASLDPPTVGSSFGDMYIDSATIGGGVAGFYTFAAGPANPAYQVAVAQPPTNVASRTWGQIKKLYR
jgi:hypothetical protein